MGLLPKDLDILPPSDDRVFKMILTDEKGRPELTNLISGIIGREVVDVIAHENELPPVDTVEKAERFDELYDQRWFPTEPENACQTDERECRWPA